MARAAPVGVDGRADEHHRSHPLRQMHGELGDDLTAHRVRDERWTPEPGRVQPPASAAASPAIPSGVRGR